MTLRCTISWLLSWHHVSNNNGITLKIMELSHLLPLQSPLVDDQPCCSNCTSGCVDFPLIFTFPLLNPLIRQSCNILTVVVPVGSNLDVVFSNNVCASVCFSWCPCVIKQSEVSQPAEKPNQLPFHASFIPYCLIIKDDRQQKMKNLDLWPTLSFTPTSQCNTCNKCCWHPPLILSSFLLSHMSKTLKTCYPLSCEWRNKKNSHF